MKRVILFCSLLCVVGCASTPRLAGEWADSTEEPLGTFLNLRSDHTFTMGDIQDGERFTGLWGTWEAKDGHLRLKITTTESCKIQTGQVLDWKFKLTPERRLVLSVPNGNDERILTRATPPPDAADDKRR